MPAFVFRWLRSSSGNGHIRFGTEPNKRVQDGPKRHWLCLECEGRLNKGETQFATSIFHPYLQRSGSRFGYAHWMIEFATSLSWRVMRFYRDEVGLKDWEPEALARLDEADQVWREVLLGKRHHPGANQQHMLPLDEIASATGDLEPNINRYLMRAVDMDIVRGGRNIFTYAKLGRFIFIGFVYEPALENWRGTKIHATVGAIEPRNYVVPHPFGRYLNQKAARMSHLMNSVSPAQQAKIDDAFHANVDRFIDSDAYKAMLADLGLFGDAAFTRTDKSGNEP
ncbi:MAG: hypothetical protein ACRERW_13150 [Pseudomonas sp.]